MLNDSALAELAQARLADARALHASGRYDGAAYLAGYALEMALKSRICRVMDWDAWPPRKNFEGLQSFKTHDLDVLLLLSSAERRIKSGHLNNWNIVCEWNPESRYQPVGTTGERESRGMIEALAALLGVLL